MHKCFMCNYLFKLVKRKRKKKKSKLNIKKYVEEGDKHIIEKKDNYHNKKKEETSFSDLSKSPPYVAYIVHDIHDKEEIEVRDAGTVGDLPDKLIDEVSPSGDHHANKKSNSTATTTVTNGDKIDSNGDCDGYDWYDLFDGNDVHDGRDSSCGRCSCDGERMGSKQDILDDNRSEVKHFSCMLLQVYQKDEKKRHGIEYVSRMRERHTNYSLGRHYFEIVAHYRIKKIKKDIVRLIYFIRSYMSLKKYKRAVNLLHSIDIFTNKEEMQKKKNSRRIKIKRRAKVYDKNDCFSLHRSCEYTYVWHNLYTLFFHKICKEESRKKYFYNNPILCKRKNRSIYFYIKLVKTCIRIVNCLEMKKMKSTWILRKERMFYSHHSTITKFMEKKKLKNKYTNSAICICNWYIQHAENGFYHMNHIRAYYDFVKWGKYTHCNVLKRTCNKICKGHNKTYKCIDWGSNVNWKSRRKFNSKCCTWLKNVYRLGGNTNRSSGRHIFSNLSKLNHDNRRRKMHMSMRTKKGIKIIAIKNKKKENGDVKNESLLSLPQGDESTMGDDTTNVEHPESGVKCEDILINKSSKKNLLAKIKETDLTIEGDEEYAEGLVQNGEIDSLDAEEYGCSQHCEGKNPHPKGNFPLGEIHQVEEKMEVEQPLGKDNKGNSAGESGDRRELTEKPLTEKGKMLKSMTENNFVQKEKNHSHGNQFSVNIHEMQFVQCLGKCEYIKKNFRMIKLLKDNTANFVYKCYDIKNKRNVAIKSVSKEKQLSIMSYNTYINIYKIVQKINNEHVVKIYDVLESQSHFFIVMELCEGTDLVEYVSKQNISFEKAQNIICQLLSGISALHANMIIHRDIKLDNLMFKDKNFEKLVIIDFDMSVYIYGDYEMCEWRDNCLCGSDTKDGFYSNEVERSSVHVSPSQVNCSERHGTHASAAALSNIHTSGAHPNQVDEFEYDVMQYGNILYKVQYPTNNFGSNNTYTNKVGGNSEERKNFMMYYPPYSDNYIKICKNNKKTTSLNYNYMSKIENSFLSACTRNTQKTFINEGERVIYNDLIIGTKEYMSPYCLRGIYSIKTDIYSIGVTIFLIIFKNFPYLFEDKSINKWQNQLITKNRDIVIPFSFLFHNITCCYFVKLMDIYLMNNNIYFCKNSYLLDQNLKEIEKIQNIKIDFNKIKINAKNIYLIEVLKKCLSLDSDDQYSSISEILENKFFA
ncbi:serine/threonine protein kinase, putative [Plasmodium ovale]|uniref:Serine/threonine protein kinase, putative n=1 Tax=Plasmodium ovale TaxID=36330 RepID=A0A1C3KM87_PLAOA|nr:serine/threonine protein kinase, putative [Plasmodium ovale]